MKIPKIISKNGHEYILVKKCNDKVYLYRNLLYGYTTCFDNHDLGLVREIIPKPKLASDKKNRW